MFDNVRKNVERRFAAQWPGLSTNVPYAFENTPVKNAQPKEFVRVSLRFGRPVNFTIGTRRIPQHPAILMIQIFTDKLKGSARSAKLADFAKSIFEFTQQKESGVTIDFTDPGELQDVGERTDYFQQNLIMRLVAHEVV